MSDKLTKKCIECHIDKTIKQFVTNNSQKDLLDPFCNDCRKKLAIDEDSLKRYCEDSGRGWNQDLFKEALIKTEEKLIKKNKVKPIDNYDELLIQKSINYYFSKMNFPQNEHGSVQELPKTKKSKKLKGKVDKELINKWGEGYDPELYNLFEIKYQKLIRSYSEKTEMHTEALLVYIRYRVKEEIETAQNHIKEAKEWGALASKAALDAKINPAQMSKSDISGGIDVMTQLFETIESEVGIIPFLPKLLEQPYDDADMIIWSIVNYIRRLEEKPVVDYKSIYVFYDEMLNEYYKQMGFNQGQIEKFLQKRNNVFRDLGKIYIEPLYQERDDDE